MTEDIFRLPDPDLQVAFSDRLTAVRTQFLQPAVLEAVAQCDVRELDSEAHSLVPAAALQTLAGRGLRAELVFALPTVLRRSPQLLAYYRLVLGLSQKAFYTRSTGLSSYQRAESGRGFTPAQDRMLPDLCVSLNQAAGLLVSGIKDNLSAEHLHDLSLLTYGPQLRGGQNVAIGAKAILQVFEVIREIVGERAVRVQEKLIELTDSTGRTVKVRFRSDPDIEAISVNRSAGQDSPLLAIEIKGGTDYSNAHNRLGEAEKSHLKAKQRGFTDLWTITNVRALAESVRRSASPTTTAFFDLDTIVARQGTAYNDFRDRLLQKLRLPE